MTTMGFTEATTVNAKKDSTRQIMIMQQIYKIILAHCKRHNQSSEVFTDIDNYTN
jgi:hypothetical protein